MKFRFAALGAMLLGVSACTQATVTRDLGYVADATASVQAACALAQPLADMAAALPVVGPFVAAGVTVGCTTSSGIAKLASDPSSAAWLGQQAQIMHDALVRAGLLKA